MSLSSFFLRHITHVRILFLMIKALGFVRTRGLVVNNGYGLGTIFALQKTTIFCSLLIGFFTIFCVLFVLRRFPIVLLKPLRHLCKTKLFYTKLHKKATYFSSHFQDFSSPLFFLLRRISPSSTANGHSNE